MRIVVLGGSGNFGERVVREIKKDPALEVIAARRAIGGAGAIDGAHTAALDIGARDFATRLAALAPQLVIHCAGPFQGQDYRVAKAALAAGAHYLDLADAREFVTGFAVGNNEAARAADRLAISGASTLPALSSAVIEVLREPLASVDEIEIAIAPGQRAPRGAATLAAVLSYLGRPFAWKRNGQWEQAWGWQELQRVRAALPLPIERWAVGLNRPTSLLDVFGSDRGGMRVSIVGIGPEGARRRRTWQLTAENNHGPEIPCMASILLARRLARGQLRSSGAYPCIGFLSLADFEQEFAHWSIRTRVEEVDA
jgi:hypothetical protein